MAPLPFLSVRYCYDYNLLFLLQGQRKKLLRLERVYKDEVSVTH